MSNIDHKYLFNENVEKMQPSMASIEFNMTYIIVATVVAAAFVGVLIHWLLSNTKKPIPQSFVPSVPLARHAQAAGRRVRPQLRTTAQISDDDSDENSDDARERIEKEYQAKKKMGVKKLAKLEMKAEKRAAREAMLIEREEKKREQEYLEHLRKQEEEKEQQLEKEKEDQERLEREEQAAKEQEAYLEMAAAFEVEEEGYDPDQGVDESDKLTEFVNFIQDSKVVALEDLASRFKLKAKEALNRVQDLTANGTLNGIIDDRGKFICITDEELKSVAKFIRQRGRVTISELVINSNKLINLNPDIKVT